ncbi:hypothetical protein [Phocaeicola barnesiae]
MYIHPNWLKPVSIGSEVCARRKRESGISFFASFKAGGSGGWRRKWQDAYSLSSPSANSFATFPNHSVCFFDSFRTFGGMEVRIYALHGAGWWNVRCPTSFIVNTLSTTIKVIDMKHIQMITMMCVICLTASCTTQKVAYRERFEEAKGYALYACIAHMNKFVDSTSVINKDYSGEYFVQLSSLSLEEIIGIKEYVDKECMNYWSISHNPEGNMIAYSSWKFYNSKDLDNFIRKTLRKNIGNNER